ncbi:alpha/beta fold hydrolase [Qaidamihabitans albus]|uniref:alpha/beta fold hydrolase n=1 Tax=Qaidamihabitans albus TaxID=2795733 RepID=UPI0018F1E26F|nr:alpha/beta hydrolase [Qaidamihabitans albus]
MTAVQREASPATANPEVPGPEIRVGHRRFAGFRTRVLEVGPRPAEVGAGRRSGLRRSRRPGQTRTAPRLVLLHGYCDSADTWRPVLERLAEDGHAAVAVDLPGFGEADPLRPGAILPQLDAFTAALLREQSVLGSVVLAGNSLGGTMGLRAGQNPRLPVSGIVSIAAPGFVDSWLVRAVGRYPLPLRLYSALPLPVPGFVVRRVAEQVIPRLLYADAGTAEQHHVRRFAELFPDYRSTTSRLEQARQLVGELAEAYQPDRVQVPLLVVACGKDRLVSAAAGRRLHALVPHSRLLLRDDWGHCPQLDDPRSIAELLTFFAAGARRQSAPGKTAGAASTGATEAAG